MLFELAVFDLATAQKAISEKVDRIELCEDYNSGGITPSIPLLQNILKLGSIDIFIMIRCRPGNFVYSKDEMNTMLSQIHEFKTYNIKGFVFGALTSDFEVDIESCRSVINAAHPLPVTFHRAFDQCSDMYKSADEIINLGFKRILTSSGKPNAFEGRFIIKDLISKFGNKIIFIPGGGIRNHNLKEIINSTAASEFHSSVILK